MFRIKPFTIVLLGVFSAVTALAGEPPQVVRHELMEDVGAAAKTVGKMVKEESPFDAADAMASFETWSKAAAEFGSLFPEGSDTGHDTEAKATIWSDRAGFEEALAAFDEAVTAAIKAAPQDLEALKAAAGPVFKTCKSCHEDYRVED
jgi:cytochrome c556